METITAQALYNLTKCAHRVYLDANGNVDEKGEVGAFVKLLWELGLQTERDYIASLGDVAYVDLQPLSVDAAVQFRHGSSLGWGVGRSLHVLQLCRPREEPAR